MAGNVVMVKHAAVCRNAPWPLKNSGGKRGAPAGVYTNLFISYEQVNRVIDDSRIEGVALTGSVEAGKSVAARAGQNLKKTTMELGGSDAFIVLEDADLERPSFGLSPAHRVLTMKNVAKEVVLKVKSLGFGLGMKEAAISGWKPRYPSADVILTSQRIKAPSATTSTYSSTLRPTCSIPCERNRKQQINHEVRLRPAVCCLTWDRVTPHGIRRPFG